MYKSTSRLSYIKLNDLFVLYLLEVLLQLLYLFIYFLLDLFIISHTRLYELHRNIKLNIYYKSKIAVTLKYYVRFSINDN